MIVGKYILLFICLGIGVALCVGAISIVRSPPDNGPPAWFSAVLGAMFFWGSFCAGALEAPITSIKECRKPIAQNRAAR